ncbi:MAG TPA: tRNA (adenosine(37)-N6)-threonylcarbamoyltransferase complex ATPase subunit type 1 TsaE [Acidimicrobiales bacterium]|nr:tRNA (adenosine(37)-N6)-threonylcarbamoyltransferase complex ATPase subunit type 1 TsaE [Acidimicrobiales bacterium]
MSVPKELRARTSSPDRTRAIAAALAGVSRPGDLVLLSGDLGAGKTTFTQGFAAALGVTEPVTSPTFTLLNAYEGRVRILHADVYRMEVLQEVFDLGLHESLDDGDIALVEWGDAASAALPVERLEIALRFGKGDDDRFIELRAIGASWADRNESLAAALEPFG